MSVRNRKLAARMKELGLGQAELARRVSSQIEVLTGKPGRITDSDVRRWLAGRTKWPQDRIRLSLEEVLGARAEDLGFMPRKKEADPVDRRQFLNAASGSALAVGTPGSSNQGRLGVSDVRRFQQEFVALVRQDTAGRDPRRIEGVAVELASRIQSALGLSTASARVQGMLHRLASDTLCSAAFASFDARAPQRARAHLDKALPFAVLSGDSEAMYRVWNVLTLTLSQQGHRADAVAGAEVMKRSSVARRDPLFASLGHMRSAVNLARLRQPSEALRALGDAERSFARTTGQQRPKWIAFYDRSELDGLSSYMWTALGDHGRAEYCVHRALAALPDNRVRNKALYTARLALSQAKQGDLELAGATGRQAYAMLPSEFGSRRMTNTLAATRKVLVASGSKAPEVVEWIEESSPWI